MNTTSVRIKFRESTIDGKEGTLCYQVIHNRMVRQIGTDYHLRSEEWQEDEGNIVLGKGNTNERKDYLHELAERIRSDRLRFARIVSELDNNGIGYTADDVVAKFNELTSRQSVQVYMQSIIRQQKAQETDIRKQYDTALHNINYNLKKIGEAIGLSIPLTMYVARHSWASAASQSNIPLHIISQCLGHDSEHTTQIYLSSIDVNQMDEANDKIIRKLK